MYYVLYLTIIIVEHKFKAVKMSEEKNKFESILKNAMDKMDKSGNGGDEIIKFFHEIAEKITTGKLAADAIEDVFDLSARQMSYVLDAFMSKEANKVLDDLYLASLSGIKDYTYPEVNQWLKLSIESLRFHIKNEFRGDEGLTSLELRIYESSKNISIGLKRNVPRSTDPEYLWDEFFVNQCIAVPLIIKLASDHNLKISAKRGDSEIIPPGPMHKYHPERFMRYRGYVTTPPAKSVARTAFGSLYKSQADALKEEVVLEVAQGISNIKWSGRVNHNVGLKHLISRKETEVFVRRSSFNVAGKRIFDIHPTLSEMFLQTDIPDVDFSEIKSPFESYYLHFGPVSSMPLPNGWLMDGAYIEHSEKNKIFQVMLTFCNSDHSRYSKWPVEVEPSYPISVKPDDYSKKIIEGVGAVISKQRKINEENLKLIRDDEVVEVPGGHIALVDITRFVAEIESTLLPEYFNLAEKAMTLVLNSIFCITTYPEKIIKGWPDNAPEELIALLSEGTPKQSKSSKSELELLGYRSISFLGPKSFPGLLANNGDHDRKASHWRKGHWREQAYGKGWAQHRRKWIWPILINKDFGDPVLGGVYDIKTED